MCGRYNLRLSPTKLLQFFKDLQVVVSPGSYKIALIQQIVTISASDAGRLGSWQRLGAWCGDGRNIPGSGRP
jgi:putative SOS response-associated peptidase YedK